MFLLEVLSPFLWLIGFIFRSIYKLFFSWWLNPTFEGRFRKWFAEDIKQGMPFLFDQYSARVVRDPKPQVNDPNMDYVCLASAGLVFKFARWHRENYTVQVAPTFAPADLCDILDVLRVIDPTANTRDRLLDTSWRQFGKLLEPRFQLLAQAFDTEHFAETKRQIAESR